MTTRSEHLNWCKNRALEYLDKGDIENAVASMMSDLGKHPETKINNPALEMFGIMAAAKNDKNAVRRFIEGFN